MCTYYGMVVPLVEHNISLAVIYSVVFPIVFFAKSIVIIGSFYCSFAQS